MSLDPADSDSDSDASPPSSGLSPRGDASRRYFEELEQARLYRSGQRFGAYELIERLGKGVDSGFGEVWLAMRSDTSLKVAIKFVRPDRIHREDLIARFSRVESKALARFNHPYIARFLDFGFDTGIPYLVMEHVAGGDIVRYSNEQRLTIDQRLRLVAKVCEALHHVHLEHIFHRDLKPQNILIAPPAEVGGEPIPKLIDFGLAASSSPAVPLAPSVVTQLHEDADGPKPIGTEAYLSPEQLYSNRPEQRTRQSEVYQLGAVLFELVVGVCPMQHVLDDTGDPLERMRRLREEDRPSMLEAYSRLSDEKQHALADARGTTVRVMRRVLQSRLARLSDRALRMDPKRRFSDAKTMSLDIGNYLASRDFIEAAAEPRGERWMRFARRHRKPLSAVGAVLLSLGIALAAVFYVIGQSSKSEELLRQEQAQVQYMKYIGAISRAGLAWQRQDLGGLRSELQSIQVMEDPSYQNRFEYRMLLAQSRPALAEFARAPGACTKVDINPEGSRVYYCAARGRVQVGEVGTQRLGVGIELPGSISDLRLSGDGKRLFVALNGAAVRLAVIDTKTWTWTGVPVEGVPLWSIGAVSNDGRWVAIKTLDRRAWLLDTAESGGAPLGFLANKEIDLLQFRRSDQDGQEELCALQQGRWYTLAVSKIKADPDRDDANLIDPEGVSATISNEGVKGVLLDRKPFDAMSWQDQDGWSVATLWSRDSSGGKQWVPRRMPIVPGAFRYAIAKGAGNNFTKVVAYGPNGRFFMADHAMQTLETPKGSSGARLRDEDEVHWEAGIAAHDGEIDCLQVSANGRRWVTSGASDGAVRVWEANCDARCVIPDAGGAEIAFDGEVVSCQNGCFSAYSGERLSWGAELWDHIPAAGLESIPVQGGRLLQCDWTRGGKAIVLDARTGNALSKVEDLLDQGGQARRRGRYWSTFANALPDRVLSDRAILDGCRMGIAASDGLGATIVVYDKVSRVLKVWTRSDGLRVLPVDFPEGEVPTRLAVSPDGLNLAVATARGVGAGSSLGSQHAAVSVIELATGKHVWCQVQEGQVPALSAMAFDVDGDQLAWGGRGLISVLHWDKVSKALKVVDLSDAIGIDELPQSLAFTPDGAVLALASQNGQARFIDILSKATILSIRELGPVEGIGFAQDGTGVALSIADPGPISFFAYQLAAMDLDGSDRVEVLSTLSAASRRDLMEECRAAKRTVAAWLEAEGLPSAEKLNTVWNDPAGACEHAEMTRAQLSTRVRKSFQSLALQSRLCAFDIGCLLEEMPALGALVRLKGDGTVDRQRDMVRILRQDELSLAGLFYALSSVGALMNASAAESSDESEFDDVERLRWCEELCAALHVHFEGLPVEDASARIFAAIVWQVRSMAAERFGRIDLAIAHQRRAAEHFDSAPIDRAAKITWLSAFCKEALHHVNESDPALRLLGLEVRARETSADTQSAAGSEPRSTPVSDPSIAPQ